MEKYYLLSLKHSSKKDACFTFWGPNMAGYQFFRHAIGIYDADKAKEIAEGGNTTIRVPVNTIVLLFKDCVYEGTPRLALPLTKENAFVMGIELSDLQGKHEGTQGVEFLK